MRCIEIIPRNIDAGGLGLFRAAGLHTPACRIHNTAATTQPGARPL